MATDALTYAHVGETLRTNLVESPVPHYRSLERTAVIGSGRADFERASAAVLRWGIQTGSGMTVDGPTGQPLVSGDSVRLTIPFGPLRVVAPARVVYVVDEPARAGFAYGTLRGAFSRPATWFWALGAPVLRLAQELYTRRYLRALA